MSKQLVSPALAQFVTATAGRNMTPAAYLAVTAGIVMMLVLTVAPAYESAHHWVDAVLWACLAFFVFEWVVRLRAAYLAQRWRNYRGSWPFRAIRFLLRAIIIMTFRCWTGVSLLTQLVRRMQFRK